MFVYFACCCFLFACLLFHQDDRMSMADQQTLVFDLIIKEANRILQF